MIDFLFATPSVSPTYCSGECEDARTDASHSAGADARCAGAGLQGTQQRWCGGRLSRDSAPRRRLSRPHPTVITVMAASTSPCCRAGSATGGRRGSRQAACWCSAICAVAASSARRWWQQGRLESQAEHVQRHVRYGGRSDRSGVSRHRGNSGSPADRTAA